MTNRVYLEDLQVGDVVYLAESHLIDYSDSVTWFVLVKIAKLTPKKTKGVTEKGKELTKYSQLYKELDDEMKDRDIWARSVYKSANLRYKLDKANFRKLDKESAQQVAAKYQEIYDICIKKEII